MSKKKGSAAPTNREAKKAIVMKAGKTSSLPVIVAVLVAVAVAAGLGLFLFPGDGPATRSSAGSAGTSPSVQNGRISHAVGLFADGNARHFQYVDADSGITIGYFILQSSDGVIRAAFDACDVCWRAGKGYYQEDTTMVCRNCGRRFASVRVNEVQGGCNPAPLERTIDGDQVVIRVEDLKKGAGYFNFAGKA